MNAEEIKGGKLPDLAVAKVNKVIDLMNYIEKIHAKHLMREIPCGEIVGVTL